MLAVGNPACSYVLSAGFGNLCSSVLGTRLAEQVRAPFVSTSPGSSQISVSQPPLSPSIPQQIKLMYFSLRDKHFSGSKCLCE